MSHRFRRRRGAAALVGCLGMLHATTAEAGDAEQAAPAGGLFERDRLTGDWGGWRSASQNAGVQLGADDIAETFGNPTGGIRQRVIAEERLELTLDLDFEKLVGWSGAILHANAYQIRGNGLSGTAVGNLLTISNIEALPARRLFDTWLQQSLLDRAVSVRIGQLAADDEFFVSQYAASFINSTFGWPVIMGGNLPGGGVAYPLSAPGARVRAALTTALTVSAGAFSGNPTGPGDPQKRNVDGTGFSLGNSAFLIAEAALALGGEAEPGTDPNVVKLGAWHQTGRFDDLRFDADHRSLADPAGAGIPATHRGDFGFYLVVDQMLLRPPGGAADQGLGGFLRLGGAPDDRNLISLYVDGGVTYKGIVPGRDDDVLGFAAAYARISSAARGLDRDAATFTAARPPLRDYEAAIELTYQAQIAPWWIVQPDLQVILHPGGNSANPTLATPRAIPDALVIGLRTSLVF